MYAQRASRTEAEHEKRETAYMIGCSSRRIIVLISCTERPSDPSPTNNTVRLLPSSFAASAAPWHAPTDHPMDPHSTWLKAVTPLGNLVSQIPKLAVPVSVTTTSSSRSHWPMRGQNHAWVTDESEVWSSAFGIVFVSLGVG